MVVVVVVAKGLGVARTVTIIQGISSLWVGKRNKL